MAEEPSRGSQPVALTTFSKSCRSYLPCRKATSPVSRTKSRSNKLLVPFFAQSALKKMTMVVSRCWPSMTVRTSETSDQVLPEEACFRMMEPRK